MGFSNFPATGGSSKTEESGEVVFGEYKSTESIYVPSSKLASGTYYLTTAAAGALSIFSYTGTSVGDKLADFGLTAPRISNKITIPDGISGLYIKGTYLGPLLFQKIMDSASPSSTSESFVNAGRVVDFGNGNTWTKVDGSSVLMGEYSTTPVGFPRIYNHETGQITVSTTNLTYVSGVPVNAAHFATNGSTIVVTTGYGGSDYQSRIYYSTNNGLTYTAALSIPGIDYNGIVQHNNGLFLVASHQNGYSGGVSSYYTSPDGITWTTRTLPRSMQLTRIRYAAGLWILFSSHPDSLNKIYTSPNGITWTEKTSPAFSNPVGISNVGYVGTKHILTNTNGKWMWTNDFQTYTLFRDNTSIRTGGGFDESAGKLKNVANHEGYAIFGTESANGYSYIVGFDENLVTKFWQVYDGPGLIYNQNMISSVFNLGSELYGFSNSSPYNVHKIAVSSVSSQGNLSGAPSEMPSSPDSQIFFSKKFNYWYMSFANATNGLMRAQSQGRSAVTKWNKVYSGIATGNIIETTKSIGFFAGTNYYRSTDGVNFSTIPVSLTTQPNYGAAVTADGAIIAGTTADRQLLVSYDDGLSFVKVGVPTGSVEQLLVHRLSDGVYVSGSSTRKFFKTTNGALFVDTLYSMPSTVKLQPANDCIIGYNTGTGWNRTMAGPILATFAFTTPINWNGGSVVQLGSLFAYVPYTAGSSAYQYYWTSPNCLTWTQRTLPSTKQWQYAYGSDSHLFISTNYDASNRQIEVQSISTTLEF